MTPLSTVGKKRDDYYWWRLVTNRDGRLMVRNLFQIYCEGAGHASLVIGLMEIMFEGFDNVSPVLPWSYWHQHQFFGCYQAIEPWSSCGKSYLISNKGGS